MKKILLALLLLGLPSARADVTASQPIAFEALATGAQAGAGGPQGTTGPQSHDHPFSVSSNRGPLTVPGLFSASVVTARAEAARIGDARRVDASAEAADVVVAAGSPVQVLVTFARSASQAVCRDGKVLTSAEVVVRRVTVGSTELTPAQPGTGEVLFDQGGVKVTADVRRPLPNGIAVDALVVSVPAAGEIVLGHSEAAVPSCPSDEAWGRAAPADVSMGTGEASSGEGTFDRSLPCQRDAHGHASHFDYTAPLQPADGAASSGALSGVVDVFLDMHLSDRGVRDDGRENAFLLGRSSRMVISNPRGAITAELMSGSCETPTLVNADDRFTGSGVWEIVDATGSFREARGSGTFTMDATAGPGTDNPLTLTFDGAVSVLMPRLTVRMDAGTWSAQGLASGRINAAVAIADDGPGDAFGVSIAMLTPDVGTLELPSLPTLAADLDTGESVASPLRLVTGPLDCARAGCTVLFSMLLAARTALDQGIELPAREVIYVGGPS